MSLRQLSIRAAVALAVMCVVAVMVTASAFGGDADKSVHRPDAGDPSSRTGGVSGLKATKPGKGPEDRPGIGRRSEVRRAT